MPSFSKKFIILLSIFIFVLYLIQASVRYSSILITEEEYENNKKVKGSSSHYELIQNKFFYVDNNKIKYYYKNNILMNIPLINYTISTFLTYFRQCRNPPQEIDFYIFYYFIFFDIFLLFIIYKFTRGRKLFGWIKILLRLYKIYLDYKSLDKNNLEEFYYNIIIILDIILLVSLYAKNKETKKQNKESYGRLKKGINIQRENTDSETDSINSFNINNNSKEKNPGLGKKEIDY